MIKTWRERCEEHPDHQSGMVTHAMIQARMQEEIDELRDDLTAARAEVEEQARLVGMGSEREARLLAERDEARADLRIAQETIGRARVVQDAINKCWDEDIQQRDALAEALRNVLPFVAMQAIGCHGDKCREQWCYSCNGEEDAREAAQKGAEAYDAAACVLGQREGT